MSEHNGTTVERIAFLIAFARYTILSKNMQARGNTRNPRPSKFDLELPGPSPTQHVVDSSCLPLSPPSHPSTRSKFDWERHCLRVRMLGVGLVVHEHNLVVALTACVFFSLFSFGFNRRECDDTLHLVTLRVLNLPLLTWAASQSLSCSYPSYTATPSSSNPCCALCMCALQFSPGAQI